MSTVPPVSVAGNPTWEVAHLFPDQGTWTEADYFSLETNTLVELADRTLEVLPTPTELHQMIVLFLYESLVGFVRNQKLGTVLVAPLRIRLWEGRFREPDVVFMKSEHASRRHSQFWEGADLVMEVVSPDDPDRDTVAKRGEYAQAGIPEYWIVDPQGAEITDLVLDGDEYSEAGRFVLGQSATSVLLPGFAVAVGDALNPPA